AQRLQPDNGEVANSLGGAYLREGRVREAAGQFLLAVRSESDNPDYHLDLGNVEFTFRRDLTAAWKIDSEELLRRALFQFREASRSTRPMKESVVRHHSCRGIRAGCAEKIPHATRVPLQML